MKVLCVAVSALLVSPGHGFLSAKSPKFTSLLHDRHGRATAERSSQLLKSSVSDDEQRNVERMRAVLAEESKNPTNMADSAERMKSMTPDDIEKMIEEMEAMGPVQRAQLKAMGMDPDLMRKSMEMMRDNPSMMASARKMMENMTPEQLMAQSRVAQEQMASMSPEQVEQAAKVMENLSPSQLDAAAEMIKDKGLPGSAGDPMVIDTMYRTAELMSRPPSGGVTLQAFATLPPISVLSGDREEDLSAKELAECWADGSLGATRVDRAGFERVWNEVREYFEGDIMDEARKTAARRKQSSKSQMTAAVGTNISSRGAEAAAVASTVVPSSTPTRTVGADLSPEQMKAVNEQVKSMSDEDMSAMLDQMNDMGPAQEARMKAMGVDPAMMKKAATMMQNNPMMRKAAEAMMKNMSPEQMVRMSQQAQQQMAGMSKEDYEKAMEKMSKGQ